MKVKGKEQGIAVDAEVGFASDSRGRGVAYARVQRAGSQHLLRVGFRLNPEFGDREVGYAAVAAIARALQRRGVRRARLAIDDAALVDDVALRSELPEAMVLPYVRLKCALNCFDEVKMTADASCDLAQRARAEVALHPAA